MELQEKNTYPVRSKEDIDNLKRDWLNDGSWDIYDAEGFEEHREELMKFQEDKEIEWQRQKVEELKKERKRFAEGIYELGPGESFAFNHLRYVRVPGGWIVESESEAYIEGEKNSISVSSAFIPFSNEFDNLNVS